MKDKKDYLDDLPEPRGVIQMCDYCDLEASETFVDFLGNEDFLCQKCFDKKIKEYEFHKEMMKASRETNFKKRLKQYELKRQKFMKANGKRI